MSYLIKLVCLSTLLSMQSFAAEVISKKKLAKSTKPMVIESRIKGSQEQPNVLYIMPWQGVKSPITVKGKEMQLVMPEFRPINPKVFKQQVTTFAHQQQVKNNQSK